MDIVDIAFLHIPEPKTIEEYTRLIDLLAPRLQAWRMGRHKLVMSAKAKKQHEDPEFKAKFRAGIARRMADPVLNAQRIEKIRATHKSKPRGLPDMTQAQRSSMYRMRAEGISREDAIKAILSPSAGPGPTPARPALRDGPSTPQGPMQLPQGASGRPNSGG